MEPEPAVEVIALGASSGGLAAMQTILRGLSPAFRCPIVLTQHRMAEVEGRLAELLNGFSPLPVVEPDDKAPILPGHVYLAPANYHLLVERGFFSLSLDPPVSYARPSIDVLFESLADSYGRSGIAVMLTGSNHDGAAGARAVKRAGGRVLVQDPATARAPEAPRAVLALTSVDAILPLEGIANRLISYCGVAPIRVPPTTRV